MMDRDRRFIFILSGIIAFGFAVRLIFLLVFDNIYSHEAEAYSKINLVSVWLEAGRPYPDINFGPLHTWLIWLLTYFFDTPVLPVRLFSLLCGTVALLPYALLIKEVFDERIALASTIFLAVLPVHVRGSATSLALAPYVLFMICGLYFYFKFKKDRRKKFIWLVWSALFLNLAGMLRFEAWLFLPPLCVFLLGKAFLKAHFLPLLCDFLSGKDFLKGLFSSLVSTLFGKETLYAVAFALMNLAFPLVHMYMSFSQTGHPMSFAKTSATSFLQYMPAMPMTYKLTGWFVSFGSSMTVVLGVLSLLGLLYAIFAGKGFHFAALLIFNFSIFQYKTLTNTIDPSLTRYTATMALLLLPFAAMMIWAAANRWLKKTKAVIYGTIFILLIAGQGTVFAVLQANKEALPDDVKQTALFLKENLKSEDIVMLDSRFHPYFMVESHLENNQFVSLRFSADRKNLDEKYLETLVAKTPPTYVILDFTLEGVEQVNSNLDAFKITKNTKEKVLRGLKFKQVAVYGDFFIYATEPADKIPPVENTDGEGEK